MSRNILPDDYNPRWGRNGQVGSKDFSVDGKAWEYRNPANFNEASGGRPGEFWEEPDHNSNAYSYTNPLYDYSYGMVRDAAKEIGINNVNKQEEVDEILAYIQRPMATQEDLDDLRGDFDDYVLSQEEVAALQAETVQEELEPYVPSRELAAANELVDKTERDTLSGLAAAQVFGAEQEAQNPAAQSVFNKYKLDLVSNMTSDPNNLNNAFRTVFG